MTLNRYVVLFTPLIGDPRVVDQFATPLNRRQTYRLFREAFSRGDYDHLGKGTLSLAHLHNQTMRIA